MVNIAVWLPFISAAAVAIAGLGLAPIVAFIQAHLALAAGSAAVYFAVSYAYPKR